MAGVTVVVRDPSAAAELIEGSEALLSMTHDNSFTITGSHTQLRDVLGVLKRRGAIGGLAYATVMARLTRQPETAP